MRNTPILYAPKVIQGAKWYQQLGLCFSSTIRLHFLRITHKQEKFTLSSELNSWQCKNTHNWHIKVEQRTQKKRMTYCFQILARWQDFFCILQYTRLRHHLPETLFARLVKDCLPHLTASFDNNNIDNKSWHPRNSI